MYNISFTDYSCGELDLKTNSIGSLSIDDFPLYKIINTIRDDINLVEPEQADIIFYGCHGSVRETKKYNNSKGVWVIGEPIPPDHKYCEQTVSFAPDFANNKNIRIPSWVFSCFAIRHKTYHNTGEKFCSTVFSNHVKIRMQFLQQMKEKYIAVDHYGRSGKPLRGDHLQNEKLNTLSNYRFNMCFENTILTGYCTEKLIHAKLAGCVPIYWGDHAGVAEFNHKSFLNLLDYENMEHFVETVKELDQDKNKFEQIKNEPLFYDNYIDDIYNKYIDKLNNIFN